jgi:hypothetical protein
MPLSSFPLAVSQGICDPSLLSPTYSSWRIVFPPLFFRFNFPSFLPALPRVCAGSHVYSGYLSFALSCALSAFSLLSLPPKSCFSPISLALSRRHCNRGHLSLTPPPSLSLSSRMFTPSRFPFQRTLIAPSQSSLSSSRTMPSFARTFCICSQTQPPVGRHSHSPLFHTHTRTQRKKIKEG